jgi:hypothetical protein
MQISPNFISFNESNTLLSEQTDEDYFQRFEAESGLLIGDNRDHICHQASSYSNPSSEIFSRTSYKDNNLYSEDDSDEFGVASYFYDADNETDLSPDEGSPKKKVSKKRQYRVQKEKTYTVLDNLVYETLKIGYMRKIHSYKPEAFIKNHLNSKFADYLFRLGCKEEPKVLERSNKAGNKRSKNLAISSKCAEVAPSINP